MISMRLKIVLAIVLYFSVFPLLFADNDKNVLLITADTLRADHLSCYGYPLPISPNIDKLGNEGTLFLSARTPIPTTSPAHASIMTSLYPHNHKVVINLAPIDKNIKTLAEILQENGYKTAAIVSAWPLKKGRTGLEKGFHFYDDAFQKSYNAFQAEQLANKATDKALKWLFQNKREKFFLWVHYFDPHHPYREHSKLNNLSIKLKDKSEKQRMGKREKTIYKYDREIAFMDFHIGRLLNALKEWQLDSETFIIFAADHGESLGEHNYSGHGKYLYEPSLHIPLIMKGQKIIPEGKVIKDEVSLLDIMPTILDLIDIPNNLSLSGSSLVPTIMDNKKANNNTTYFMAYKTNLSNFPILGKLKRGHFAKSFPDRISLLKDEVKFIYSAKNDKLELYNLKKDVSEEANLAMRDIKLAKKLKSELILWFNRTKSSGLMKNRYILLNEEDIEKLKSLGYIN